MVVNRLIGMVIIMVMSVISVVFVNSGMVLNVLD